MQLTRNQKNILESTSKIKIQAESSFRYNCKSIYDHFMDTQLKGKMTHMEKKKQSTHK